MGDFWQHGPITTLHRLPGVRKSLLEENLRNGARERPLALLIPALASEMEAWYERLAPLYGVEPGTFVPMTIEFAYRPPTTAISEFGWSAYEPRRLYAPSLHQLAWTEAGHPSSHRLWST